MGSFILLDGRFGHAAFHVHVRVFLRADELAKRIPVRNACACLHGDVSRTVAGTHGVYAEFVELPQQQRLDLVLNGLVLRRLGLVFSFQLGQLVPDLDVFLHQLVDLHRWSLSVN